MDQSYRRHYSGAQRGGRRGRSHRRRYPDQHPQQEAGPNDDDQSESRDRNRPPRGFRGRAIGMWYANRGRLKREHAGRLHVTLDNDSVQNIQQVLNKHSTEVNTGASTSSITPVNRVYGTSGADNQTAYGTSGSDQLTQNGLPTEGAGEPSHFNNQSTQGSETLAEFEGELSDFLLEYSDNLLQNQLSDTQESEHVTHKCTLQSNELRNRQLKERLEAHNQSSPLLEFRKKLPAYELQSNLVKVIQQEQVVVISGETGCGKTTQVTQFILDDMIRKGAGSVCNIICTQPRRISAISVAERVAEERGEALGASVGYSIRLANRLPRDYAAITYCTTGILLRRLRSDKYLTSYSHVIVDEVHERDIQTDFLLILLRDLLPRRPDLKVVLMSATLNAQQFSQYFHGATTFTIPGFTFPVTEYYLEDIIDTVQYSPPSFLQNKPSYHSRRPQAETSRIDYEKELEEWAWSNQNRLHVSNAGMNSILQMNHRKVHPKLVSLVVEHICRTKPEGAILVFLPGWADISEVNKLLQASLQSHAAIIIPLHSMMPTAEQKTIFQRPPRGVRKIILATNIAETSITIDDVVYVVNTGKIKMKDFLTDRNMATLDSVWVSKANSRQRRGRAGRVQPGICYHLYTRHHDDLLEDYLKPEMLRTRLENVCLDVKLLGQGLVEPFLLKAMNPPSKDAIQSSISLLKVLNAFDDGERLTPLGYHLARMPLDPHTGKMVLMSAMFSCIDPILTIAACLNFKDPFHIPLGKEQIVDEIRSNFSRHSDSDHLMYYYAVKGWEESMDKSTYCYDNFLSNSTMSMISKMKGQFADLLYELKFIASPDVRDELANQNSDLIGLIRAVLCSGLYPNIAKVYKRGREDVALSTNTERKVKMHKKSINSRSKIFKRGQWVIYYEIIQQSGNVCLMDSTLIPAFPIMFFGGELKLEIKGDGEIIPKYEAVLVNDWINFECQWSNAELINKLRKQLNEVLESKITNPAPTNWDHRSKEGAVLQAIIDLFNSETVQRSKYNNTT